MKARIRGAEIAYDVRGQGPALLLLHAFPLGLAQWDEQARVLSGASQVVRFDARGFGGSPPGDGLLTMERIADDAAGLLDHLQIGAATVCGLSMGGYAAFAFVVSRPHRDREIRCCHRFCGRSNVSGQGKESLAVPANARQRLARVGDVSTP